MRACVGMPPTAVFHLSYVLLGYSRGVQGHGVLKWYSKGLQIAGANKFRTASAEIADKIRRLVEVLQSGLQVSTRIHYPVWVGYALEYPLSTP